MKRLVFAVVVTVLASCGARRDLRLANDAAQRFADSLPNVIGIECSAATDRDGHFCRCNLVTRNGTSEWVTIEAIACACVEGYSGCYK